MLKKYLVKIIRELVAEVLTQEDMAALKELAKAKRDYTLSDALRRVMTGK